MANHVLDGVMGLCVADALGVPVEFIDRQTLKQNPVVGMRAYGTYHQPAGTWSDDTSMTLCLVDSLSQGLDYNDMMVKFTKWFNAEDYTPFGNVFDIGNGTREALLRFKDGVTPLECGGTTELDNGNGSLMRIMPILFYLKSIYGKKIAETNECFEIVHNISALTHRHKRSQLACGIYISIAAMLLQSSNLKQAVTQGIYKAMEYYRVHVDFANELVHFNRLGGVDFDKTPSKSIRSSGYVVDTLEAVIWCLLTTKNYRDCVLKAVNLGQDTDTVAAVAGGLAGLHYGYKNIPEEWLSTIVKRDYIEELCNQLNVAMYRNSVEKLLSFIPYFENATKESVVQWIPGENQEEKHIPIAFPQYEPVLRKFIAEVYQTNLMSTDYLKIINEKGLQDSNDMNKAIEHANLEVLRAILTGYIRQERFSDGLWAEAVENKVFLKILRRLDQVV